MPTAVKAEAIAELSNLQNARTPAGNRFKILAGNAKLSGVGEIRLNAEDGNTYRVYATQSRGLTLSAL